METEEQKDEKAMAEYRNVLQALDDIENNDENIEMLEKAMEHYCGNYDICEGFKQALRYTLNDQYHNHLGEQAEDDLDELKAILKIN